MDCQPAIISAFGTEIPKHNVDVILNIRQISSTLQNNGHSLFVHWIPGHKDFKGNELADCLAKNAAKEMIGKKEDFFEGVADRSILLTLMKQEVTEKWQKIYVNSPKSDTLQDVITEVGKSQPSIGDRKVEAIINQLITGQLGLNYSRNTHFLPPKPKSSFRHLKRGIQDFHMNYVLVPADKAANNVVVV